jgi:hypothetical protein
MSGEKMSNDSYYDSHQQPQLEIVELEQENDHTKLMRAYHKLNQKIDSLIQKKKKSSEKIDKP